MKTVDKRIIKTKNAIRSSFVELVQQKNMSELSISELTKKATITRSTFYMYYQSLNDVRDEIENEMLKSLEKFLSNNAVADMLVDPYPFLKALSDKIMRYDEMNHYLVCGKDSGGLIEKIKTCVVNAILEDIPENDVKRRIDVFYAATFISSGILEAYKQWFHNQDSISLENLCKRFSELILVNVSFINS